MFKNSVFAIVVMLMAISCVRERKQGINALVLVPSNTGANYYLMSDVMEEYGWKITHTGVSDTIMPCPWFASHGTLYPIISDIEPVEITDVSEYDCLIIAPSTGNAAPIPNSNSDLLQSNEALALIRRAAYYGLPVYSTCAGVRVLAAADVVRGKFIVGSPRFRDEYTAAGANYIGRPQNDNPPTIDGNIVTSARGQYYNYANVMAIASVVENNQDRGSKGISKTDYVVVNVPESTAEDLVWVRTYGGAGADGGRAFCQDPDGGYLIVGYTFAPGSNDADMLVIKTDENGAMVWSKRFGGKGTEYGNACLDIENGFLVLGYTTSFGKGSKDVYLVRLDKDGEEVWSRTYGGASWDVGTALCETGEDQYFICGFTGSFGWGEEDIYLIKIDEYGNEIWSRTFGGFRIDMANSIHATADSGCVIGASSGSYSTNTDFSLTKINAKGERQWVQSYSAAGEHGHGFDWCKDVSPTNDGGFVIAGYSDCNDMMDAVVLKTDAGGNKEWLTSFGNKPFYDYGNSVCQTDDGGYVMAGITKSMKEPTDYDRRPYTNHIYLVRLDPGGNALWERSIDGVGGGWANEIQLSQKGDYLILGHTTAGVSASLDVCFLEVEVPED
jgi:hypothetical protein